MKRFALFAGDDYYPGGGWKDFRASFDTEQAAMDSFANTSRDGWVKLAGSFDWWHLVDLTTGERVRASE